MREEICERKANMQKDTINIKYLTEKCIEVYPYFCGKPFITQLLLTTLFTKSVFFSLNTNPHPI